MVMDNRTKKVSEGTWRGMNAEWISFNGIAVGGNMSFVVAEHPEIIQKMHLQSAIDALVNVGDNHILKNRFDDGVDLADLNSATMWRHD